MAAPADPVITPTAGLVNVGTDPEITPVVDVTFYYTIDGTTPNQFSDEYVAGAFDGMLAKGGDNLTIKAVAYNDADAGFLEPSNVVVASYNAVGFGGSVDATSPAVVDTNVTQYGAAMAGIGLTGADGASVGASRLGGSAGTDVKFETGDGVGV